MKKYFLHNGVDQQGPFDLNDLITKNISRETPIWYEGLPEWTNAEKIEELKSLFITTPPQYERPHLERQINQKNHNKNAEDNIKSSKKTKIWLYILILFGVFCLAFCLLYLFSSKETPTNNINSLNSKEDSTYVEKPIIVEPTLKTKTINIKKSSSETLIGNHNFGVQFIWDGYGKASISDNGENLKIEGEQLSNDKSEYCKINGTLDLIDNRTLKFNGNITLFTNDCCGIINKTGSFTFIKTGSRKYWRLQERDELCSEFTCCYYLDIFE